MTVEQENATLRRELQELATEREQLRQLLAACQKALREMKAERDLALAGKSKSRG